MDTYPLVRVDLMGKALDAFFEKQNYRRGWSTKAEDRVFKVVSEENWLTQIAYLKRCHAIRNLTKNGVPASLRGSVLRDGSFHESLVVAVALSPLRKDGKFRTKELVALAKAVAAVSNPVAAEWVSDCCCATVIIERPHLMTSKRLPTKYQQRSRRG